MPKYKIDELNELYEEAKRVDREIVAEMRSSILLLAGEHYTRRMQEWFNRSRTTGQTSDGAKLRITKNWLHRAHRLYVTSITSQAPGTAISPRNELELQDQKDAELNQAVWNYIKDQIRYTEFVRTMASDYTGIGECAVKVYFDPNRGYFKGNAPQMDESGEPILDENGQSIPDENSSVFSGEMVFERVYPHNLFRDPSAKQMNDSKWLGVDKMQDTKALLRQYEGQPDKKKLISDSTDEYVVFDSAKGGYSREKNQCLVREFFFKPSPEYPNGYYYITTKAGVLEEGELPAGKFPIIWKGMDEAATRARATGIVKVARPWQAEINRASSQVAMHQITISEDKVLYQAGTKVSQGALLPGVRGLTYQGTPPTILPGRSGDQYFEYIGLQVDEMSRALMLDLLDQEKVTNLDPVALLFRSMQQTQAFSIYSQKFGEFLVDVTKLALELAKFYLPDDEVIAAVGKSEVINIEEFRKTSPLCHQIKVEEQTDTIDTKLGKQLVLNHILQYVGTNLAPEDIGRLATEMPFGNFREAFKDKMIDSRNVKNDFLAIERGQMPYVSPNDNSDYILSQIATRKKERDYALLDPQVQGLYDEYEQIHLQKKAEEAAALKAAQAEFIPTGGALVACDMYVPAEDPTKAPKRVRIPYQALEWTVNQLKTQGMGLEKMEQMNNAQVAAVLQQLQGGGGPQQQTADQGGQASPMGVM